MMSRPFFFLSCCLLFLTACQRNFDPVSDSSVRDVSLELDPTGCFRDVLTEADDSFQLGLPDVLPPGRQLLVRLYCYDASERLVRQQSLVLDSLCPVRTVVPCLDTAAEYSLLAVASLVSTDSLGSLLGNWLALSVSTRSSAYVYQVRNLSDTRSNILLLSRWQGRPSTRLSLPPFSLGSYNGFLRLTNLTRLDQLYVRLNCSVSAYLWSQSAHGLAADQSQLTFSPDLVARDLLVPVSLLSANRSVRFCLKRRVVNRQDSITCQFPDSAARPFVCTVDCNSLRVLSTQFY